MEKSELIAAIKEAFKDTIRPTETIDLGSIRDPEIEECDAKFTGKTWQDISILEQNEYASGIHFLLPEAYRYYLPGYMVTILEHGDKSTPMIDPVIRSLLKPILDESTRRENSIKDIEGTIWWSIYFSIPRFEEIVAGITPAQGKVIKDFLQYVAHHYPDTGEVDSRLALLAVERYWNKFI